MILNIWNSRNQNFNICIINKSYILHSLNTAHFKMYKITFFFAYVDYYIFFKCQIIFNI